MPCGAPNPWRPEEEAKVKEFCLVKGPSYVAQLLGRSVRSVSHKALRLGLSWRKNREFSESDLNYLRENYEQGDPKEIGKVLGKSARQVISKASKLGFHNETWHQRRSENYLKNRSWQMVPNFFDEPSRLMAWHLGYIITDGYISRKRGVISYDLQVKDERLLEGIQEDFGSEYKIRQVHRRAHQMKDGRWVRARVTSQLSVGNRQYVGALASKWGVVEGKSLNEHLPELPEYCRPDLVRGICDGDGCIYLVKDRRVINTGLKVAFFGGKKFLESLWNILPKTVTGGSMHERKSVWMLSLGKYDSIALCEWMYAGSPERFLERKFGKYCTFLDIQQKDIVGGFKPRPAWADRESVRGRNLEVLSVSA